MRETILLLGFGGRIRDRVIVRIRELRVRVRVRV